MISLGQTSGKQAAGFDGRADSFDRRSAPPADAAAKIAAAVVERAAEGPFLDLGAGTGALGAPLAELCAGAGRPYLGLDFSLGMLAIFRRRLRDPCEDLHASLLRCDAGRAWPVASHRIGTIFAARVAHLLDPEHLARQIRHVLQPGGNLLLATVRRDPASARSRLRRLLHRVLDEHGIDGRSSRRRHGELSQRLSDFDATAPEVVCEWSVRETLGEILAAWRRPGHLAGRQVPGGLRKKVLERLEAEAETRYDPESVLTTIERFEIVALRR